MRNLYVIYVMRDPRDSAVSRHGVNQEKYYGDLRYWKRFLPFYEKIRHHPRFIQVKYEDMVRNPDEVQATIEQHIPFLKYKDSFSNFHLHARPSKNTSLALRGLRKVDAGGIGNWKNHKARLLGQITLHGSITEDLIRYGYEQDDSWLEQLEGEEPDLTESHAMPFYEQKFIRNKQYFRYIKALKVWFFHTDLYLGIRSRFHRE